MAPMTKRTREISLERVPRVPELYPEPPGRRQRGMPNITLRNPRNNRQGDWGHQLRGGKRKGNIRITFQNMGGIGNESDQPSQHKLYSF